MAFWVSLIKAVADAVRLPAAPSAASAFFAVNTNDHMPRFGSRPHFAGKDFAVKYKPRAYARSQSDEYAVAAAFPTSEQIFAQRRAVGVILYVYGVAFPILFEFVNQRRVVKVKVIGKGNYSFLSINGTRTAYSYAAYVLKSQTGIA